MRSATNQTPTSLRQDVYLQLRDAIERGTFAAGRKLPPSMQGMHLAHEVSHQVDDRAFSLQAAAAGVTLTPLSSYCLHARRRGWLFGYAGFNEATLRTAAQTLAPVASQRGSTLQP
jgi:GntR family transcriptional regulator / MocR family aminotransferase